MKTIKSGSEITDLFEHGQRIGMRDMSLIYAPHAQQHDREGRVAFIAGKKLGNAVWRNRAKRRMRGVCAAIGGPFPGYDVIFLARRSVNDAPFKDMTADVEKALAKRKILG